MGHKFKSASQPGTRLLVLLTGATGIWYLGWRLTTLNPEAMAFSIAVYAAEVFSFVTLAMFVFMVWSPRAPQPARAPKPGRCVDIYVATYNEDPELLRKTLIGCNRIRYPHTTWVLDDGRRPEVEALARELGCEYLTRPDNRDAKAGNLNHALPRTNGEFVVTLDADHIPLANFLDATLGYFEDNPWLAFVQMPQTFYNLDSIQHRVDLKRRTMWEDQSLFFHRIQTGKNRWNAAFYCGSPAVLRRKALESVGGFQTGTITEDLHTSIALHKKGWESLFVPQTLAYGQAAPEAEGFQKQRRRWGIGAMQVLRRVNPLWTRGLTLPQRINYFASMVTYFEGLQKLVFYLAPVIALVTAVLPIRAFGPEFFARFLPYFALSLLTYRGYAGGWGQFLLTEQYNLLRFYSFLSAAVTGIFRKHAKFHVTRKQVQGARTRAAGVAPQLAVAVASLAGIVAGLYHAVAGLQLPYLAYVTTMLWAGFNFFIAAGILRFTLQKVHRRSEFRFPEQIPVRFTVHGETCFGVATDLNTAGMQLQTSTALPAGTLLAVTLYAPGRTMYPVVAVQTPPRPGDAELLRYGLRFEQIAAADRDYLSMLLLEHSMPRLAAQLEPSRTPEFFTALERRLRAQFSQRAERLRHSFLVEFEYPAGKENLAVTDDWSESGLAVLTDCEIPQGTRLRLTLHRGAEPEELTGEVMRAARQASEVAALYRIALRVTAKAQVAEEAVWA